MKKISNEVKVGATALLTIVVFVWLFNFLKGKDFLKSTAIYYSVYDKVGGLAESSPVEINGYKVGVVRSVDFIDAESGRLLVVFSVNKNFKLPKNTVAEIVPISLLGGMKVQFVYGKGPGTYSEDDTIPGRLAESLVDKVETEFLPVKEKISNLIVVLDSVISSVNEVLNADFKKELSGTLANLNSTTASLDKILSSKEKELKATIDNVNKFTQMLSDNSGKMNKTFNNLESITDTIAAADVYKSVSNLKTSLEKASLLMDNMNKGKGSAGQFLTNDTLYTNLTSSLESLNLLLKDMKTNPKRYVHFSIFGKKSTPSK
ncbi:MAG: MlaD family protein [Bacteroidales bacterium]|jgi:phospholipid/cholesterol/gamma-HCH transport system substrate-binding protein